MSDHTESRAEELLSTCQQVVERAQRKGADDVEVFANFHATREGQLEQNDVKGGTSDEGQALGIRVIQGGSMGFAYVNRLDEDALNSALDDALAVARVSPADDANVLAERKDGAVTVEGLWDPAIAEMGADDVVLLARRMLDAARAVDDRVSIDTGNVTAQVEHFALASSRGVGLCARETALTYGLFGMAVDGDEVGSFDYRFEGVRTREKAAIEALSRRWSGQVLEVLAPGEGPAYRGKVLFGPEAFEEIFVDTLLNAVDGDVVFKGKSRLAEKLGKAIAPPFFNLVDDGTLPGELASSISDREGMPHGRLNLVENGQLSAFMYDCKSAARAGAKSTGHASGSARNPPQIGNTNVILEKGDAPEADLPGLVNEGIWVERFSGNVNSVSGDFSGVAKNSFRIEGGKKGAAIKETLISGNVFDLLPKVVAMGDQLHRNMAYRGPRVVVDDVQVVSGA
jgi:PmbA protein